MISQKSDFHSIIKNDTAFELEIFDEDRRENNSFVDFHVSLTLCFN
jgi:hypothetical protein